MADEKEEVYLTRGSLLCHSTGSYSDYRVGGFYVALEDLYRSKLREIAYEAGQAWKRFDEEHDAALEAWEKDKTVVVPKYPESSENMFIAALIRAGLLLPITYTEIHVDGGYGSSISLDL